MPNDYGRRLMPTVLHHETQRNPERTFAIVAKSDNIEDGFLTVTFGQVAQAVNHVSRWLETRFESGQKPPRHATLAYIGVPDLRYNILFYAAVQCRYKVRCPSTVRFCRQNLTWSRSFCPPLEILPLSIYHC
jgi:acyl-CoA synthetase (AMP-forming)/AMP-acid ligase II